MFALPLMILKMGQTQSSSQRCMQCNGQPRPERCGSARASIPGAGAGRIAVGYGDFPGRGTTVSARGQFPWNGGQFGTASCGGGLNIAVQVVRILASSITNHQLATLRGVGEPGRRMKTPVASTTRVSARSRSGAAGDEGPGHLGYLEEPGDFHDAFGQVPMLMHPVIADHTQAHGQGGLVEQAAVAPGELLPTDTLVSRGNVRYHPAPGLRARIPGQ
jgi:hypothetical protein